jgi:redox-sensitive bicupin YhaK (pirin superfamily)
MKTVVSKMKTVRRLHRARREDIGDLVTRQALPVPALGLEGFEPFIFLNHHGPQVYPPHNAGLPFGPHPHRGFETVTFILEGDLTHRDSGGCESLIRAGGVQWMTAGRGLVHSETSSDEFMRAGGPLEILQLWLNLPARLKMTEPRYVGLQREELPTLTRDEGRVTLDLVAGEWEGAAGGVEAITDVSLAVVRLRAGGRFAHEVGDGRSVFFYVVRGAVTVNGGRAAAFDLVEFEDAGRRIEAEAAEAAVLLFGHAAPNREPLAARGPFVMNTDAQIIEAIRDYHAGKFGVWRG